MKRNEKLIIGMKIATCAIIAAVILALVGLELYVGFTYKDVPVGELPTWAAWLLFSN